MDVYGIKDGTAGLMQRPVAAVQLTHKTFEGYLLRQGGTFLGSTNKGNPFKFPTKDGKFLDKSKIIIKNLNPKKRPISAVADNIEVRNAKNVIVKTNKKISFKLLYDKNKSLQKKIKIEQLRREIR